MDPLLAALRPKGPCPKCLKAEREGRATLEEISKCDHLGLHFDYLVHTKGWTIQNFVTYAVKREVALAKDNERSTKGVLPEREYTSMITKVKRIKTGGHT